MKLPCGLLLCAILISGCSNAKDKISAESLKDDLAEVTAAKIQRDSMDIEATRRLYLSAYKEDKHSELNDELFIYTLHKMSMLWATYQVMELDFKEDIQKTEMLTPLGVDGLCIMNKFLKKYRSKVDPKFNDLVNNDFNRAMQYQPIYEKRLSNMSDPLSENLCLSLK